MPHCVDQLFSFVRLNGESEAGTSLAGNVTEYQDLANFQATDPNGDSVTNPAGFTASINWGDGTSSKGEISGDYDGIPWLFEIDGGHAYPSPSNGEYDIQVTLTDPDGGVWYGPPSVATVDPRPDELRPAPSATRLLVWQLAKCSKLRWRLSN